MMPLDDGPTPDELPLPPRDFEVLLVLVEAGLHGYGIVKAIESRTGGSVRLEPANLYRRLRRLMRQRLVVELEDRPTHDDDPRRRYYGLTEYGRSVLQAEARRLRELVAELEARNLLPETSESG